MARLLEATPTLYGEDARRLVEDMKNVCTPEEAKRRSTEAALLSKQMLRPPGVQATLRVEDLLEALRSVPPGTIITTSSNWDGSGACGVSRVELHEGTHLENGKIVSGPHALLRI